VRHARSSAADSGRSSCAHERPLPTSLSDHGLAGRSTLSRAVAMLPRPVVSPATAIMPARPFAVGAFAAHLPVCVYEFRGGCPAGTVPNRPHRKKAAQQVGIGAAPCSPSIDGSFDRHAPAVRLGASRLAKAP
jgi:hypothetical protein